MKSFRDNFEQTLSSASFGLEDSGAGERLERFGSCLVRRPSSQALWQRSLPQKVWDGANAIYHPKKGWQFSGKAAENVQVALGDLKLMLLFQDNGQIGIFPEHLTYFDALSRIVEAIAQKAQRPARILNLFAYTGAASVWCALHGCDVTHVELSKKVLSWSKENQLLNPQLKGKIRFIPEDALVFLEREEKRASRYDLIIADPPSFSRLSKSQSWDLEDVAADLVSSMSAILNTPGSIVLTSHHPAIDAYAFENLLRDSTRDRFTYERRDLVLAEKNSPRSLHCGSLLIARDQSL